MSAVTNKMSEERGGPPSEEKKSTSLKLQNQCDGSVGSEPEVDSMKYYLTKSLYWKSLEDMLDDFMQIGRDTSRSPEDISERSEIIMHMLELPLEFDTVSRQLSVDVILRAIKRNSEFTNGCTALIIGLIRKKSSITEAVKKDFFLMLQEILLCEEPTPNKDELPDELEQPLKKAETSLSMEDSVLKDFSKLKVQQSSNLKKGRRYAKILIELYRSRYLSATVVLVYLEKLTKKQPNHYFADVIIFILQNIGLEVENRVSNGVNYDRESLKVRCISSSRNSTFDTIYHRLHSFLPFAMTPKLVFAAHKIIQERNKRKSGRARSAEKLQVVQAQRKGAGQYFKLSSSQTRETSGEQISDVEASTSL